MFPGVHVYYSQGRNNLITTLSISWYQGTVVYIHIPLPDAILHYRDTEMDVMVLHYFLSVLFGCLYLRFTCTIHHGHMEHFFLHQVYNSISPSLGNSILVRLTVCGVKFL